MTKGNASTSTFVLAWMLTACGGGGGSTGGSSGGGGTSALTGALNLIASTPAESAVNVAPAAAIELTFDGALAGECLADDDTWLEGPGATKVAGAWSLANGGRTATFQPDAPLGAETDYVMHVSSLTCDNNGRLLEVERTVAFRTVDPTPPSVLSASVREGALGVPRTASITVSFSEALDSGSISSTALYLSDAYGTRFGLSTTLAGDMLTIQPDVDLPGDRAFVLVLASGSTGVRDRAGNPLGHPWSRNFRTSPDTVGPTVSSVWPQNLSGASPRIAAQIAFDESVDPASLESSSVIFTDQFSSIVPFRVETSRSQRTLRLVPTTLLVPGHRYSVTLLGGGMGATDLSGNPMQGTATASFTVGNDSAPPVAISVTPTSGASRVSLNVIPSLTFSEALDPASVTTQTVRLRAASGEIPITVSLTASNTKIVIAPAAPLAIGTEYSLRVDCGPYGVRDTAGNPLAADFSSTFATSLDATLPSLIVQPAGGSAGVPTSCAVSIVSATALDPASVTPASVRVRGPLGQDVTGTVTLTRGGRVVRFTPGHEWAPGTTYTLTILGAENGLRETSGNWLTSDVVSTFRTGYSRDSIAPTIALTLNKANDARKGGMLVPSAGFTVDVTAIDSLDYALDVGTFDLTIAGPGPSPTSEAIFAVAEVDGSGMHYQLPAGSPLVPGAYTVQAAVRDLTGNLGTSSVLSFTVESSSDDRIPFERTQVVWTRFDMDRDGNGRPDFEDDLYKLGFLAEGDPSGTNARMVAIVRDGILAKANQLFHRSDKGAPLGADSVPIRMVWRRPLGVAHMQLAVGGLDPEGPARRDYGAESTGTLGRAYFDAKNGRTNDLNIATRPGLGVFPAEMFLFQAKIHTQVYPAYTTTFAKRFLSLCASMGGTPAGAHGFDATVLAKGFDFGTASLSERARYLTIMQAADDWCAVIGVILAHEIGHSVGLVAPGVSPIGLHGDSSLHDDYAGATDVMAAAVGYDALVSLDYDFRDLDLAYLRQRLLLR